MSPKASLDYIPPNCSLRNNNSIERSNPKRNNLPPSAVLAIANTADSIITSPPCLDGEDSYKGESCASFEFVGKPKTRPSRAISVNGSHNSNTKQHLLLKQRSLENKRIRNDSDSALECNKVSNCKRSPSFKEAEEIRDLLKEDRGSSFNKKDGCCQTDKKDLRKLRSSPLGQGFIRDTRISPSSTKLTNLEACDNIAGPFEREIQKLLDEQNLLQNIPPKLENQPIKDLEPLVRYAPNNNNHQVGLAAIQALALGLRVNPAQGSVTLQCISPTGRASSKEGSLKRGPSPPGPPETHKLAKVSPLDRYSLIPLWLSAHHF